MRMTFFTFCSFLLLAIAPLVMGQNSSASPRSGFRIAGTVVSTTTNHPLASALVELTDAKNRKEVLSVVTGDDGRFEFAELKAGKYSLSGAKRGFIQSFYNQHDQFSTAIVTGAGLDTETLVLSLPPVAVISGEVFDESGQPVRNASVTAYREDRSAGVSRIRPFTAGNTDDEGYYELTPLLPGTYFVGVTATPWYALHPTSIGDTGNAPAPGSIDRELDVAYPTTYFGDTTEADDATPIPVKGGDRLQTEIHLSPVPTLHLQVHQSENGSFPTLLKRTLDGMEPVQSTEIRPVGSGVYEMTGIPAGRYSVQADSRGAGGAGDVNLTNDGDLDVSGSEPASSVHVSAHVLGENQLPSHMVILLRNQKGSNQAVQELDDKGEADFQNLTPGEYEVRAGSRERAYYVVRITSENGATLGHSLNVAPGRSTKVTLSIVGGMATVEGIAKRDGKGISGAMIVLVPDDPESHRELFRRDQSDQDGTFLLPSVIPGSYTLLAIEDGWDLDWAQPAVIASYAKHGQKVTIRPGVNGTFQVPEAVQVQSR